MTPLERLELGNVEFGTMTLADIKALVRRDRVFQHYGLSGTNVAFMTRDECISFLTTGDTSFKARLASLGNREERREGAKEGKEVETITKVDWTVPVESDSELQKAFDIIAERANRRSPDLDKLTSHLEAYVDSRLLDLPSRRIEVSSNGTVREVIGAAHERFELVLKVATAGVPLALVGPVGSGKTSICDQVGEALGLDVRPMSFNPLSSKADILGFTDANGKYHMSLFRLCFEVGGIFVGDEFDACHPGVAVILNAAIANRKCSFADNVTLKAHPDFRAVICMNTFGTGATSELVGRNRLDAATLDRFAYVWLDYDKKLEPNMIGGTIPRSKMTADYGSNPVRDADHWLGIVHAYRAAAAKLGLRHIISPRASIMGMQLAEQGIGITWLTPLLITKGLQGEDLANLEREAQAAL